MALTRLQPAALQPSAFSGLNITDGSLYPVDLSSGAPQWTSGGSVTLGNATASTWDSNAKTLEFPQGALMGYGTTSMTLYQNAYLNASTVNTYKQSSIATGSYQIASGVHTWRYAAAGTAGNPITYSTVMLLDTSGNLVVGNATAYAAAGGGTTRGTFGRDVDDRALIAVTNQSTGSSASAALVLGAYGADWSIATGSAAKNSNTFSITYAQTTPALTISGAGKQVSTGSFSTFNGSDFVSSLVSNKHSFLNLKSTANNNSWSIYSAGDATTFNVYDNAAGKERMAFTTSGTAGINTTASLYSDLTIRYPDGGSGSLSLACPSTGGGGASYILMGNNDSGGTAGPNVIVAANRAIQFGAGSSFTSRTGGTFSQFFSATASQCGVYSTNAQNSTNGSFVISNASGADAIFEAGNNSPTGISSPLRLSKYSTTSRSISCAGTVTQNGADYAEYMYKADVSIVVNKGDIVGINADGKLTDVFDDALSFVVKSTDPGLVGGDTWFLEPRPVDEETGQEVLRGSEEFAAWDARMEEARAHVDRIAYCGQVPVNVLGATAGQYIVPVKDGDKIKGIAVTNPTFDQYMIAVGKVISIQEDGRAYIIVKIA